MGFCICVYLCHKIKNFFGLYHIKFIYIYSNMSAKYVPDDICISVHFYMSQLHYKWQTLSLQVIQRCMNMHTNASYKYIYVQYLSYNVWVCMYTSACCLIGHKCLHCRGARTEKLEHKYKHKCHSRAPLA